MTVATAITHGHARRPHWASDLHVFASLLRSIELETAQQRYPLCSWRVHVDCHCRVDRYSSELIDYARIQKCLKILEWERPVSVRQLAKLVAVGDDESD